MELAGASNGDHWVGQGFVATDHCQVMPMAVVLEGSSPIDVQQSVHALLRPSGRRVIGGRGRIGPRLRTRRA